MEKQQKSQFDWLPGFQEMTACQKEKEETETMQDLLAPERLQKEEQEMRNALEIGDEIVTIGGIVGRVVTIRENDLIIETGADRNKMKIERWAINTNKTKNEQHQKEVEAAREAAKEKKAAKKAEKENADKKDNK